MRPSPQKRILAYLLEGGALTVKTAWAMTGTTELRRIVSRLKAKGYRFATTTLYGETKDGRRACFKEYRLAAKDAAEGAQA